MEQEPARGRPRLVEIVRRRPLLTAAFVLLVVLAIIFIVIFRGRPPEYISSSGTIEATEVAVASKVIAKATEVLVNEGDEVKRSDRLVSLKDTEFREQVQQAEANLAAAQARLNEALAGARPEVIRQARARVRQAAAAAAGARRSLDLAEQELRESRDLQARLEAAESSYRAAVAAHRRAQEALKLVREGPRAEQIRQARAQVEQAEAVDGRTREDVRRARELFRRGAISASELDAAEASAETARAQLEQARARLAELEAGSRPAEVREAEAAVEQARAVMEGAGRSLDIARRQYDERLLERQRLTTATTQYETAAAQLNAAEAGLQELLAGTRPEQIEQLRAQVNQARAALSQARTQLGNTIVESPSDGTVLTRAVEPGELATVGSTLVVLANLNEVWLRVYVEQTVYGRIRLGQRAAVTVDSYPGESFDGKVMEIASEAEFTPKQIQTREERAKLVFGVKIALPNPENKLKPGMPADASLKLYPVSR